MVGTVRSCMVAIVPVAMLIRVSRIMIVMRSLRIMTFTIVADSMVAIVMIFMVLIRVALSMLTIVSPVVLIAMGPHRKMHG